MPRHDLGELLREPLSNDDAVELGDPLGAKHHPALGQSQRLLAELMSDDNAVELSDSFGH